MAGLPSLRSSTHPGLDESGQDYYQTPDATGRFESTIIQFWGRADVLKFHRKHKSFKVFKLTNPQAHWHCKILSFKYLNLI